MKKITIIIVIFVLSVLGTTYFVDPVFEREVSFCNYSVKYEWRIFNNSYCNFITAGHCYTNQTNKLNAEIELYRQLLDNINGQEKIAEKLKEVVNKTYRFDMTYSGITKTRIIEIDSLKKHKDEIFKPVVLK